MREHRRSGGDMEQRLCGVREPEGSGEAPLHSGQRTAMLLEHGLAPVSLEAAV